MTATASPEPHDDSWREESDARIRAHRQGDVSLRVLGADGQPLRAPVRIVLERHAFGFGAAVNRTLTAAGADADRYRDWVRRHCSLLVSENDMKWYTLDKESGVEDAAAAERLLAWAAAEGLAVRGHCLLWAKRKFVQQWVQDLPGGQFLHRVHEHLERTLTRYAGRVVCWDSLNEMLDGDIYPERLGPDAYAALHRAMNRLAPAERLFVNEYSIIDNDAKTARYLELIGRLRSHGVRLGGIGVQEHAAERFAAAPRQPAADESKEERQGKNTLVPGEVWARLDRLAATGLPIHLTEISFRDADEARKAEALERFYRTLFAHPAVEAILLWGFWEKAHWLGRPAALLAADWTPLPAMQVLEDLLHREWHTELSATPDARGLLSLRGFYGAYRIEAGGRICRFHLERDAAGTQTVLLRG
jgi:endo-1,4-beta-xylanase